MSGERPHQWDLEGMWRAGPVGAPHRQGAGGRDRAPAEPLAPRRRAEWGRGERPAPDPRVSLRALRPGRTPAGILAALMISVVGWAAAADLIWVMLGAEWGPLDHLGTVGKRVWGDPMVAAAAGVMIVSGLALVVHAVKPGRPRLMPLATSDPLLALGLTRSGLRRTLAAAVRAVDGAGGVHVGLRARRIEITVTADARRTGPLLPRVGAAVGNELVNLGAECGQEVVVRLRPGRS